MSSEIFRGEGGRIVLPTLLLCDRHDGGHLVVEPPRPVWERSLLMPAELCAWALLVAAAGRAMLQALPMLEGGCINYWEAGNWALNDLSEPQGPKRAETHRRVHLHLLGRSRRARAPHWQWGESPRFPDFKDAAQWSAGFAPLTDHECEAVAREVQAHLRNAEPTA